MTTSIKRGFPLNVAVLGSGFGAFHIRGVCQTPEMFMLKNICDINRQRVDETLDGMIKHRPAYRDELANCEIKGDYREALDDPKIDAVAVSLPHHLHEKVCVEAAEAGKHIVVDKPIARTLEEADRIIEAVDRNKVTMMTAFNMRFMPMYKKIHDVVVSGEIGEPLYAIIRHYQGFNPPAGANWRSKESVGGGCVMGSGIHNIDLMRWCLGEPDEVFAYGNSDKTRLEAEAVASISFKYKSGLVVNFTCNWVSSGAINGWWHNFLGEFEVFGSTGDVAIYSNGVRVGHKDAPVENVEFSKEDDAVSLWKHFGECIKTGAQPMTHARDSRKTLALVLNAYKSMETGCPVKC